MPTGLKHHLIGACALALSAALAPSPAPAQDLTLNASGYFETRGVNYLVFSNWYDGLFADAKISGVEIVHQGERTATNGDVRLSATPGQWDPIGRMVSREVDAANGTIEVRLEYPDYDFRYRIRAERVAGGAVRIAIILDEPLPAALAGRAGFNLEFLPSAYFHRSFIADGRAGAFPLHPSGDDGRGRRAAAVERARRRAGRRGPPLRHRPDDRARARGSGAAGDDHLVGRGDEPA